MGSFAVSNVDFSCTFLVVKARRFFGARCKCRLADEARENQKRRDELAERKCELRQKERCVAELTSHNDCLKSELDLASTKLDKYQCEMELANQRSVSS